MKTIQEKIIELRRQEEEGSTRQKAIQLNLSYFDPAKIAPDATAVGLIPEETAKKGQLAIIRESAIGFWVAVINPENEATKEALEILKKRGRPIKLFLCSLSSLQKIWRGYELVSRPAEQITGQVKISQETILKLSQELKNLQDIQKKFGAFPANKASDLLEAVLAGGLKINASDIHIETTEENTRLRYRIDGILQDAAFLSFELYRLILSRIKLLSGLKLNIHDIAQDGRFTIQLEKTDIEIRVSCLPGNYGENLVLRILNPKNLINLEELGLRPDLLNLLENEIKKPNGMLINTGPTGSGKTTTLYACLSKVNQPDIKIITLEDPVEYHLNGITQTQIEPEKGYNFTEGLSSILRHDPDIILVGEIRDKETAKTAIQAALTGHIIFTTLHTNDAIGAIPRLLELGATAASLAPALNLIIAQRLVRRLCPKCKKADNPSAEELEKIKKALKGLPDQIKPPQWEKVKIYRPKGCPECSQLGYLGRIALFEMIAIDEKMKKLITKSPSQVDILETAQQNGFINLYQDGVLKVLDGITALEEVERVAKE